MNINKLTFVSLLSALFITAGAFAPGYAAETKPPVIKEPAPPVIIEPAPTGADCLRLAEAAAEKVRKNGGTAREQQAAYGRAKENCKKKM